MNLLQTVTLSKKIKSEYHHVRSALNMAHMLYFSQRRWRLSACLFLLHGLFGKSLGDPLGFQLTSPRINGKFFWRWAEDFTDRGLSQVPILTSPHV